MRNLKVSNQTEELIGEKSVHQGVGQCFPHVEKGSFFSGDAYLADSKSSYRVRPSNRRYTIYYMHASVFS